jgi:hypothetical protein
VRINDADGAVAEQPRRDRGRGGRLRGRPHRGGRLIAPDRGLGDFARADVTDDLRPLVLKQSAARLLGLAE